MQQILTDTSELIRHIIAALQTNSSKASIFPKGVSSTQATSAVLLLLGGCHQTSRHRPQPCFIFTKRSKRVRQSGDLCFPGGGIVNRLDAFFSKLLKLPFSPIARWPHWHRWRQQRPCEARRLLLLLAAGLREALEEVRLNPFAVRFLGPMPPQRLRMFRREIYPMVAWVQWQRFFSPNWEVEKILKIPFQKMLEPDRYACCRMHYAGDLATGRGGAFQDFPCFLYQTTTENEVLWGATYRITIDFLRLVFDFVPPPVNSLPMIHRTLGEEYIKKNN